MDENYAGKRARVRTAGNGKGTQKASSQRGGQGPWDESLRKPDRGASAGSKGVRRCTARRGLSQDRKAGGERGGSAGRQPSVEVDSRKEEDVQQMGCCVPLALSMVHCICSFLCLFNHLSSNS